MPNFKQLFLLNSVNNFYQCLRIPRNLNYRDLAIICLLANIAVFTDVIKALDFVSHKLLLNKIYEYGLHEPSYDLIKSYL